MSVRMHCEPGEVPWIVVTPLRRAFSGRDQHDFVAGRLRLRQVRRRQVLNLRSIKHGVSLEERDRALDFGPDIVSFLADDAVGVDDGGTMLALPNMRAELHSLAVGHPQWGDVAAIDGLGP